MAKKSKLTGAKKHIIVIALGKQHGFRCHYCGKPLLPIHEKEKYEMTYVDTRPYRADESEAYNSGVGATWTTYTLEWPTLDHKVPVSLDGTDEIDNLVLACQECNYTKRERYTYDEFVALRMRERD